MSTLTEPAPAATTQPEAVELTYREAVNAALDTVRPALRLGAHVTTGRPRVRLRQWRRWHLSIRYAFGSINRRIYGMTDFADLSKMQFVNSSIVVRDYGTVASPTQSTASHRPQRHIDTGRKHRSPLYVVSMAGPTPNVGSGF